MTKQMLIAFCGALALAGCKGDDGIDTSDTDNPSGACDINISGTVPADNATGVYFRSVLEWTFTEVDNSATVALSTGGADVAGTTSWDENTLLFEPSANLMASTQYDATVTFCDGATPVNTTFTTSDAGNAITPGDLPGQAYLLDLASGNFVEPPGVGPLLQQQLTVDILLGVISADATNVNIIGALGEDGANPPTQDICQQTIDFPIADFNDNPYFEVGPDDTLISVQGIDISIDDLFVSGAFAPGGSSIEGAVLEGSIDTRPLVDLIEEGGADDAVCALVATFGITCSPCSGGGDFCLDLLVDSIEAGSLPGENIVVRSQADVDIDPNCVPVPVP